MVNLCKTHAKPIKTHVDPMPYAHICSYMLIYAHIYSMYGHVCFFYLHLGHVEDAGKYSMEQRGNAINGTYKPKGQVCVLALPHY